VVVLGILRKLLNQPSSYQLFKDSELCSPEKERLKSVSEQSLPVPQRVISAQLTELCP